MRSTSTFAIRFGAALVAGAVALAAAQAARGEEFTYQVTGLFLPQRADDLKAAVARMPGVELARVDFETAAAVFRFDPKQVFPTAKPEQVLERFDQQLKEVSQHTFSARALPATPREKLKRIEIRVQGLDCKACAWAAYQSIYKLEGVTQATVDFRAGVATAWLEGDKTDAAALAAALTAKGVKVLPP